MLLDPLEGLDHDVNSYTVIQCLAGDQLTELHQVLLQGNGIAYGDLFFHLIGRYPQINENIFHLRGLFPLLLF